MSLRFEASPSPQRLAELGRMGVDFERDADGGVLHLADVFAARVHFDLLERLGQQDDIRRVEATWQPGRLSPLEVTGELVGAPAARRRLAYAGQGADSRLALIDTGIDVLHPAFFYADGGFFPWLDVNQNGVFDPGVDAVDLDRDGQPDHNETLRVLDATTVLSFSEGNFENQDGVLQVDRDWLYADMNGDRQRNVGLDAGFNETTPAYGEALFVVDDADGDGVLGPDERLVRLSTSKIRAYTSGGRTFQRGEDLIEAGGEGVEGAFHGTAAAGVLAGGQSPYHTRVGLAPQAELLVYGLGSELMETTELPLAYLSEAVEAGADVVLHEWTNAFTQPLDGSTNFEAAMQAARDEGAVQINPVGNLNRSQKHSERAAAAGEQMRLAFDVPAGFDDDGDVLPIQSVFGSLQWGGPHELELTVESPDGERAKVGELSTTLEEQPVRIDITVEVTSRGTTMLRFYLESTDDDQPLAEGRWALELEGFEQSDTVYGRVSDVYSNWQRGVGWVEATRDRTTVAFPATADAAFGVAAFAARRPTAIADGAEIGELRTFSGRGPRPDGQPVVDLAAPDDPFVPLGVTPHIYQAGWGHSWFTAFGGTSGAAPHVAGAVALLRELHPQWSADQIEASLTASASSPAQADELPDNGWGAGKLDVYRALYDESRPENRAPELRLNLEVGGSWAVFDVTDSSDPDGDELEFRYDLDYDGHWDTDWIESTRLEAPLAQPDPDSGIVERPVARVEVRDTHGAVDGIAVALEYSGGTSPDAGGDASLAERSNPPPSSCTNSPAAPASPGWLLLAVCGGLIGWRRDLWP
ncbi:MAG: S8 family serine peptidase [Persicimonas sp.]